LINDFPIYLSVTHPKKYILYHIPPTHTETIFFHFNIYCITLMLCFLFYFFFKFWFWFQVLQTAFEKPCCGAWGWTSYNTYVHSGGSQELPFLKYLNLQVPATSRNTLVWWNDHSTRLKTTSALNSGPTF
jgi:hypothetical protein